MELMEIDTPPKYPDAYWAAGDEAFQLLDPLGLKRIARLRANINHNLLLHRRLFLGDTSILVNPSLFALLRDEEYGPGYQQLFRDGLIVTAMRTSANNYSELAEKVIEKRHFVAEMDQERMRESARLLDSLRPRIVRFDTRRQMREIGDRHLLKAAYWASLGLPDQVAIDLTDTVKHEICVRGLETVRQSEFWEYAHNTLVRPEQAGQAQQIRAYMTIASLGSIAKDVGLPPIFPAAYGPNVDRLYGTHTPWRPRPADTELELLDPFEAKSPRRLSEERSIHGIAALLTAEQISEIRNRGEHQKFLKELQRIGDDAGDLAGFHFDGTMREFKDSLEVSAGEFLSKRKHRGTSWLWETPKGQFARLPISGTVGYVVARLNDLGDAIPDKEHLLGSGAGVSVSAAMTFFTLQKVKKSKSRKEDFRKEVRRVLDDATVIPELRTGGFIEMSLFGTIPYQFDTIVGNGD